MNCANVFTNNDAVYGNKFTIKEQTVTNLSDCSYTN